MAPPDVRASSKTAQRPSFKEDLPFAGTSGGLIWVHRGNRYDHPRHRHDALELNLVVSGRSHYEVAGRRVALSPGSLLWIHPDQDHEQAERSPDFRMWIVALHPRLLRDACADGPARCLLDRLPAGDACRLLPWEEVIWLDRELGRLATRTSPAVVNAGLSYCVLGAWEVFGAARHGREAARPEVAAAMALLDADPALSRAELADRIGVCPTRLTRAFTDELRIGLGEYRTRVRVERFAGLIRNRGNGFLAACFEAGFGSYAQCHRAFLRHMGCSPRDYVERSRPAGAAGER